MKFLSLKQTQYNIVYLSRGEGGVVPTIATVYVYTLGNRFRRVLYVGVSDKFLLRLLVSFEIHFVRNTIRTSLSPNLRRNESDKINH